MALITFYSRTVAVRWALEIFPEGFSSVECAFLIAIRSSSALYPWCGFYFVSSEEFIVVNCSHHKLSQSFAEFSGVEWRPLSLQKYWELESNCSVPWPSSPFQSHMNRLDHSYPFMTFPRLFFYHHVEVSFTHWNWTSTAVKNKRSLIKMYSSLSRIVHILYCLFEDIH